MSERAPMDELLDSGQVRLLHVVAEARGVDLELQKAEAGQYDSDRWFEVAKDVLSAELVAFGINDVIVNRYGLAIEGLIDRLSDVRSARRGDESRE